MKPGDRVHVSAIGGGYESVIEANQRGANAHQRYVRTRDGKKRHCVSLSRLRLLDPPQPTRAPLERPAVYDAPAGVPVHKDPPGRSEPYLRFVRERSCCSCPTEPRSEAHHYGADGGMSMKCSDYRTVPLCHACHRFFHAHGHLPGLGVDATHLLFMEVQNDLLVEWISRKEER